jgi:predicted type IV restriction endonuclease
MTFEAGLEQLRALRESSVVIEGDRNEATTRLQLIDHLFFDILGWSRDTDVKVEEPHGRSYADYVFFAPRRLMIVEAKREGQYFTIPAGARDPFQPLPTVMRGNPEVAAAIEQVAGYCQERGVPIGVACNGHQLVAFLAARADGQAPLAGRALTLASFEQMEERFRDLWDGLSKKGIEERRLVSALTSTPPATVPPKCTSSDQMGQFPLRISGHIPNG